YSIPESDSYLSDASACCTSRTLCQRSSGDLRKQREMICSSCGGTSGATSIMGRASSRRMAESVDSALSPEKARDPVDISYSTRPKEKISERPSTFLPCACSGDM